MMNAEIEQPSVAAMEVGSEADPTSYFEIPCWILDILILWSIFLVSIGEYLPQNFFSLQDTLLRDAGKNFGNHPLYHI